MKQTALWNPSETHLKSSAIAGIIRFINDRYGIDLAEYDDLYQWSIKNTANFWEVIWDYCEVKGDKGNRLLVNPEQMPGAQFFPDATLNFAENLLRKNDETEAIVFRGEDKVSKRLSWNQLNEAVSRMQQALLDVGLEPGDRVAAYMPNIPETVVAMLATASLGGIWCSCSPDFGEQGVLDRFGQIEAKVLLACDGYFYAGKQINNLPKLAGVVKKLSSLEQVVVVPYLHEGIGCEGEGEGESATVGDVPGAVLYADFIAGYSAKDVQFKRLPFNHPLYILFSSGTTGAPKCIVHGAGGTLLQHLKEHQLHANIKRGDRFFYFTTCTWMMWNWLVSGLASQATLLLYDGSPFHPDGNVLWKYAEEERMTQFGTSAKYLETLNKQEIHPRESHNLEALRFIASTGSPLAPEGYDFVYQHIKEDVYLGSIAGGTDIVSCFVLSNPIKPVYRGEIPCRGLGMAVEILDEQGNPVLQQKGELVCSKPFPSMPLKFWGDVGDEKYRATYFETYPNRWMQGDFAEITETGGVIIYGRSDATLNPGGVRIGSAEIYRQVEQIPQVLQSVVIGQQWKDDVRLILFVMLAPETVLDDELVKRIKTQIRTGASPRHVPAKVIQVTDIPLTKSGKITELAVRDVVAGRGVKNLASLANPQALENFKNIAELSR